MKSTIAMHTLARVATWSTVSALSLCMAFGCGSAAQTPSADPPGAPAAEAGTPDPADSGGGTPASDAAAPTSEDGTPSRVACTSTLGKGLSQAHGRLDGQLVAIVAPTDRKCPADPTHLHLQVLMGGSVYDVAVNLDGFEGETDAKLPGAAFAEGWHPMDLDYVSAFGLHSTALNVTGADVIRQRVVAALATANHISVFGEGYTGSDGVHLIHRSHGTRDGALLINPLAPKAHVIAFRFATDTF